MDENALNNILMAVRNYGVAMEGRVSSREGTTRHFSNSVRKIETTTFTNVFENGVEVKLNAKNDLVVLGPDIEKKRSVLEALQTLASELEDPNSTRIPEEERERITNTLERLIPAFETAIRRDERRPRNIERETEGAESWIAEQGDDYFAQRRDEISGISDFIASNPNPRISRTVSVDPTTQTRADSAEEFQLRVNNLIFLYDVDGQIRVDDGVADLGGNGIRNKTRTLRTLQEMLTRDELEENPENKLTDEQKLTITRLIDAISNSLDINQTRSPEPTIEPTVEPTFGPTQKEGWVRKEDIRDRLAQYRDILATRGGNGIEPVLTTVSREQARRYYEVIRERNAANSLEGVREIYTLNAEKIEERLANPDLSDEERAELTDHLAALRWKVVVQERIAEINKLITEAREEWEKAKAELEAAGEDAENREELQTKVDSAKARFDVLAGQKGNLVNAEVTRSQEEEQTFIDGLDVSEETKNRLKTMLVSYQIELPQAQTQEKEYTDEEKRRAELMTPELESLLETTPEEEEVVRSSEVDARVTTLKTERESLVAENEKLQLEYDSIAAQIPGISETSNPYQGEINNLKTTIEQKKTELAEIQAELADGDGSQTLPLATKENALKAEIKGYEDRLSLLESKSVEDIKAELTARMQEIAEKIKANNSRISDIDLMVDEYGKLPRITVIEKQVSVEPSVTPSVEPTVEPTKSEPSVAPSVEPTVEPTKSEPSVAPSVEPTVEPTKSEPTKSEPTVERDKAEEEEEEEKTTILEKLQAIGVGLVTAIVNFGANVADVIRGKKPLKELFSRDAFKRLDSGTKTRVLNAEDEPDKTDDEHEDIISDQLLESTKDRVRPTIYLSCGDKVFDKAHMAQYREQIKKMAQIRGISLEDEAGKPRKYAEMLEDIYVMEARKMQADSAYMTPEEIAIANSRTRDEEAGKDSGDRNQDENEI